MHCFCRQKKIPPDLQMTMMIESGDLEQIMEISYQVPIERIFELTGKTEFLYPVIENLLLTNHLVPEPNQLISLLAQHVPIKQFPDIILLLIDAGMPTHVSSHCLNGILLDQWREYIEALYSSGLQLDSKCVSIAIDNFPPDELENEIIFLVQFGISPNQPDMFDRVIESIPPNKQIMICEMFLRHGLYPDPTFLWTYHQRLDIVELLLKHGCNPNTVIGTCELPNDINQLAKFHSTLKDGLIDCTPLGYGLLNLASLEYLGLLIRYGAQKVSSDPLGAHHLVQIPLQMRFLLDHGFSFRHKFPCYAIAGQYLFDPWIRFKEPNMLWLLLPKLSIHEITHACEWHFHRNHIPAVKTILQFQPDIRRIYRKMPMDLIQCCVDYDVMIPLTINDGKFKTPYLHIQRMIRKGPRLKRQWLKYHNLVQYKRLYITENNYISQTCSLPTRVFKMVLQHI